MLKLKQRPGSPNWYIFGTIAGHTVRESTGTTDEAHAKAYLAKRQAELYSEGSLGRSGHHSFGEALNAYLESKGDNPISHTDRDALLELLNSFELMPLKDIDQRAVDDHVRRTRPKAKASTQIRRVHVPLTAVMNHAAKRGWCNSPSFDRPKVITKKPRYLSYIEAAALVDASGPAFREIVRFCLNTGCRISEALFLGWHQVDLDRKVVTFGLTDEDKTKNDETRAVPLNAIAFQTLVGTSFRDGPVFTTNRGVPYERREGGSGYCKTAMNAACKRAGIERITAHGMRHTCASWLIQAGHSEAIVAEILGHKSRQRSITGRYTHFDVEHLRPAVDSIVAGQMPATSEERMTG